MNQNQNQTETKVRRFKHKRDGYYQEFAGENGTYIYPDGRREESCWTLEEVIENPEVWVEVDCVPSPEPKPMTIREAAKKLQEMGISHVDDVNVRLVWRDSAWHLECSVYRDTRRYTGSSFELVFKQIEAIAKAKAGISLSEADRIIDL